jgi:hypothetical protein
LYYAHLCPPRGEIVQTDEWKMTSLSGVYAAGDISRTTHSIPFATAPGAQQGLLTELWAEYAGRILSVSDNPERDKSTLLLNPDAIRVFSFFVDQYE